MQYKIFMIILPIIILFSGCGKYVPLYNKTNSLTKIKIQAIPEGKGHIIFSDFDVPQLVNRTYFFNHGLPFDEVSIFDITEDLTYIATIYVEPQSQYLPHHNTFAEVELPLGKRTLMLIRHGYGMGTFQNADFTQINVVNDHIMHVAISHYPYLSNPNEPLNKNHAYTTILKFTQLVDIPDEAYHYCSQNICKQCGNNQQKISDFLNLGGLKTNNPYFNTYCQMLSDKDQTIYSLNQNSFVEFEKYKKSIEIVKEKFYPQWQSNDHNRIFFISPK